MLKNEWATFDRTDAHVGMFTPVARPGTDGKMHPLRKIEVGVSTRTTRTKNGSQRKRVRQRIAAIPDKLQSLF